MPKRKPPLPPLEELLDRVFCYYCERIFIDYKSLQDHQKTKHLQCQHCRKKMDSLGGLKVHVESVHKMPLDKIQNALPDRESADGPEIYLMEGVPQELVDSFRDGIIKKYQQEEYEHRLQTGNPLPGSAEAQNRAKRVKVEDQETPEERAAKRKAHVARRRAEIAARDAAKERGGDAGKDEPSNDFTPQQGLAKLEQNDHWIAPEQTSGPYVSQPFNGYSSGYATSPPMGGLPMSQPPPQTYGYASGPQYGYSPTNYGQPHPFQPNFPDHTYPQQHVGYGYAGSPQSFPQQPMTGRSPITHQPPAIKTEPGAGVNGKSTMPAAPSGLPQRPSFDTPSYSREDMQKLHAGRNLPAPKSTAALPFNAAADAFGHDDTFGRDKHGAHVSTNPDAEHAEEVLPISTTESESGGVRAVTEDNIQRGFDDLLYGQDQNAEVEKESAAAASTTAVTQAAVAQSKQKKTDAATSKDKKTIFKANVNDTVSPEEKKSKQPKYAQATSGSKKKTRRSEARCENSVVEQADSQAVTGSVADDLEQ